MDVTRRRIAPGLAALAVAGLIAGCGAQIPADPGGTLDRVAGGELRVGASPDGELVTVDEGVGGALAHLVQDFADRIDADVAWTVASEESLVVGLEEGRLDLAIGGMTDETPWADRVGVTRGFAELAGVRPGHAVVMLVPLGENRFLAELERFLDERSTG